MLRLQRMIGNQAVQRMVQGMESALGEPTDEVDSGVADAGVPDLERPGQELTHPVQDESDNASPAQTRAPADPCSYRGDAVKDREVHLNLSLNALRVYERSGGHTQFDNLINGPSASALARANGWCHMYSVKGHQRRSRKGLIHFVNYCGNFGFHSNFWAKDGKISRIPGSRSHGCARLHDADETSTASGDSIRLFNLVHDGDCVRLYSQDFWRDPTFRRCPSNNETCRP